ncbi:Metallo-dependent hydrolase [Ascodesmis nigricans]|uniref:Metallo-dependent hydrolase n=1 Tax=Ascodesmis nigricans TaxID=341454 RepID=A0A4S2MNU9_9PEZI|nr:Metallo-dependent hydrolase [Ascodesmis nigricans]
MPPRFPYFDSPTPPTSDLHLHGTFIDFPTPTSLRIRLDTEVTISPSGTMTSISPPGREFWAHHSIPFPPTNHSRIFLPGFIDTHLHAPQYPQLATKTDLPLMEWLETYTFPLEARFADPEFAEKVWERLVKRLLRNGTTGAVMFASKHVEATKRLAGTCGRFGLRAAIGKVCSDRNVPEGYMETREESLRGTEEFVKWCKETFKSAEGEEEGLVVPVVTPRFIPTCTPELLRGLSAIAKKHSTRIQTHAAESLDEILLVQSLHPIHQRDISLLTRHHLLTPRTILAHCCHLTDPEAKILGQLGTSIASCPTSNLLFAQAVLPVRRFQERFNVNIALGTDIAGGHSISMLSAIRQAGLVSRVHGFRMMSEHDRSVRIPEMHEEEQYDRLAREGEVVDWVRALYMATTGGAVAAGWEKVGVFEVGMRWDAVEVDLGWDEGEAGEKENVVAVEEEEEEENGRVDEVVEKLERWWSGMGGRRV